MWTKILIIDQDTNERLSTEECADRSISFSPSTWQSFYGDKAQQETVAQYGIKTTGPETISAEDFFALAL